MAERKSFSGSQVSYDYLGIARSLLAQLVASMQMNNLQVLSKGITLENGVRIDVSSSFGQHEIHIDAPETLSEREVADIQALPEEAVHMFVPVTAMDTVHVAGVVQLTLITAPEPPPVTPTLPPPTPPDYTPDPGGTGTPSDTLSDSIIDRVFIGGVVSLTLTVRTPAKLEAGTGPSPPQIFIAGGTTNGGDAFVWDDVRGYTTLDLSGGLRRRGAIYGLSPNGQVLCGSMEIYDASINKATINPFTGKGGTPVGYVTIAAKWQSRTDKAQVTAYTPAVGYGQTAYQVDNAGSTVLGIPTIDGNSGTIKGPGFQWDGQNNHGINWQKSTPARMGLISPNGRVQVSGGYYKIDGGPWLPWQGSLGLARNAPTDAAPLCVVHVPYTAPTVYTPGSIEVIILNFVA